MTHTEEVDRLFLLVRDWVCFESSSDSVEQLSNHGGKSKMEDQTCDQTGQNSVGQVSIL